MAEKPPVPETTWHGDRDVNVRAILIAGVVFVVAAVVIHIGIYWVLQVMRGNARRAEAPTLNYAKNVEEPPPNFARLQDGVETLTPADEMKKFKREEANRLTEYGWVDREKGIVRIPVAEAMRLVVDEGLPSRGTVTPGETPPPPADAPIPEGGAQ